MEKVIVSESDCELVCEHKFSADYLLFLLHFEQMLFGWRLSEIVSFTLETLIIFNPLTKYSLM